MCSFEFLYSYYVLDTELLVVGVSIHLKVCVCVHSCPSTQLTQSKVQNETNKWTMKKKRKKKQEKIRCRLSNGQIISFTLRWSPSLFYRFFFIFDKFNFVEVYVYRWPYDQRTVIYVDTQQMASRHKCRRRMEWKEMKMVFYTRETTHSFCTIKFCWIWRDGDNSPLVTENRGIYSMNTQPMAN